MMNGSQPSDEEIWWTVEIINPLYFLLDSYNASHRESIWNIINVKGLRNVISFIAPLHYNQCNIICHQMDERCE
jgi:hypothetical protein